ncbi:MAG: hypothetical protein AAF581_10485 [Planctomycetota bacterium]
MSSEKKDKPRKRAKQVVGLALLVLLGLGLLLVTTDSAPPDDSDLMPTPQTPIPDAENGYVAFEQALNTLQKEPQGIYVANLSRDLDEVVAKGGSEGLTQMLAQAQTALEANNQPLQFLEEAARRPRWQASRTSFGLGTPDLDPLLNVWFLAAKLRQRPEEAARRARVALTVGALARRNPYDGFEYDQTTSLMRRALYRVRALLDEPSPLNRELRGIEQWLATRPPTVVNWAEVQRRSYADILSDLTSPTSLGGFDSLHFLNYKPNRTRQHCSEIYRLAIAAADGDDAAGDRLEQLKEDWVRAGWGGLNTLTMLLGGNAAGDQYTIETAVFSGLLPDDLVYDTQLRATLVVFALRHFVDRYEELPDRLEQLVPEFLPAVPTDPFDETALKYSRERRVVYGVGYDRVDNGGDDSNDEVALIPWKSP